MRRNNRFIMSSSVAIAAASTVLVVRASFGQPPPTGTPAAENKVAVPTPKPEDVRSVWRYFYEGQGGAPVLVDVVPCLTVDSNPKSPTAWECSKPVQDAAPNKSTVHAWTAWLVPEGDEITEVTVQWLHEGQVRTTKDLSVKGRSIRQRAYVAARVDKPGRWQIVVSHRGSALGKADFEVK